MMPAMALPWQRILRPLDDPPAGPGANAADIADLLPATRSCAAVLVPLIADAEGAGSRVLFTVRTRNLRTHAGEVAFPGGRSERCDVDAVATALRETHEETGILPALVQPLGFLDTFVTISGFVVTPVVGLVAPGHRLRPDPTEVDHIFDVPLAHIRAPGNLQHRQVQWHGRPRTIHELHWDGHRIWGATAGILSNLVQRLDGLA